MLTILPTTKSNPTCAPCPLATAGGSRFIAPSGTGAIPLLVLTDQPGDREQLDSLSDGGGQALSPRSPAGLTFSKACSMIGLQRDQVWKWHMTKCQPPPATRGKDSSLDALTTCHTHLMAFVDHYKPKAILALGDVPIRWLTGYSGRKQGHMNLRGYILDNQRFQGIPVVAGIDPAHIINVGKPILRRALAHDLQKAVKLAQAGGQFKRPDESRYEMFPSMDRLRAMYDYLKEHPQSPVYYDIETHESFLEDEQNLRASRYGEVYRATESESELDPATGTGDDLPWDDSEVPTTAELLSSRAIITQIQFACDIPDWAVVVNWCPEVARLTQDIFNLPNLRVGWNNRVFDDPILRAHGIQLVDAKFDAMDAFHRYEPDLPKGLGFVTSMYWPTVVPWKHLSQSDPGVYGCRDVIAPQRIYPMLRAQMDKVGIGTSFQVHDMQLGPALDRMSARGYPNDRARKDHMGAVLQRYIRILKGRMKGLYPTHLLPFEGSYEEKPTVLRQDYTENDLEQRLVEVDEVLKLAELRTRKGKVPPPETLPLVGMPLDQVPDNLLQWFKAKPTATGSKVQALRWMYRRAFNPGSRAHILAYLEAKLEEEWVQFADKDLTFRAQYPTLTLKEAEARPGLMVAPRGWKTNHVWYVPTNPKEREFKAWIAARGLKRLVRALDVANINEPLLPLLIKTSSHARMYSSFVMTWKPSVDNLVFTTFKFSPATPQLASVNPNILADPKHGSLAKWWRWVKKAHTGKQWVSFDYSGFHAITTGFLANDPSYINAARIDIHGILGYINEKLPHWDRLIKGLNDPGAMSRDEISLLVKGARTSAPIVNGQTFKERRDEIYKRCIAEGSLVLTQEGLVPIEKITLAHKVWDGVDWVHHEGLIDQGIRGVITYEGLTATPDHIVFTAAGREVSLSRAASQMDRLERTGAGRQEIRTVHGNLLRDSARRRLQESAMQMSMRQREMGPDQFFAEGGQFRMQGLRSSLLSVPRSSRPPLRRFERSVYQSYGPSLGSVWGARDSKPLYVSSRVRTLGGAQPASPLLQGRRDRSDRQQRSLRTGEFTISYPERECREQGKHPMGRVWRHYSYGIPICRTPLPLRVRPHKQTSQAKSHRGANHSPSNNNRDYPAQEMEIGCSTVKRARTFDLLNAGPRRCFTVSDCLVANCVLGIQLGMGSYTMFMNSPESFGSKAYAQTLIDKEKQIWPKIFAYQDAQRTAAAAPPKYLRDAYGYLRRLEEVTKITWNAEANRWDTKPGPDSEKAVSACIQSSAFGFIRDGLIWLDKEVCPITGLSWAEKFGLVNNVHDSYEFHCPVEHTEECLAIVGRLLQRRSQILVGPAAPEGLWCAVEASVGQPGEGADTQQEVKIPVGPFAFPVEGDVGWPQFKP